MTTKIPSIRPMRRRVEDSAAIAFSCLSGMLMMLSWQLIRWAIIGELHTTKTLELSPNAVFPNSFISFPPPNGISGWWDITIGLSLGALVALWFMTENNQHASLAFWFGNLIGFLSRPVLLLIIYLYDLDTGWSLLYYALTIILISVAGWIILTYLANLRAGQIFFSTVGVASIAATGVQLGVGFSLLLLSIFLFAGLQGTVLTFVFLNISKRRSASQSSA